MPGLTPLPLLREPEPLCRIAGHTCAACCYGDAMPGPALASRLRRHTALFSRLIGDRPPSRLRLLLYELMVRGVSGLAWALLLLTPVLASVVRPWLRRRIACVYLGFEDADETRVGCLLHPARWNGRDVRREAAFAWWRGFGCGESGWRCAAAWIFARSDWRTRRRFLADAEGIDWFTYSHRTQTVETVRDA
jgi:hypothetical protein